MKLMLFKNCNLILMAVCFNITFLDVMSGYASNNDTKNMICEENVLKYKASCSEVLDFGFVLLSETTDGQVSQLAENIHTALRNQTFFIDQDDYNVVTRLPHVSMGQYAIKECEFSALKSIVDGVAKKFEPITQFMSTKLSVTDENIFLDAKNLYNCVEPILKNIYLKLRCGYMTQIKRKYIVDQAVVEYEKQVKYSNRHEVDLIDRYFQNWGIPEDNRMRPHYTLIYNYNQSKSQVEDIIHNILPPIQLQTITFSHLGIVSIDFWGNPKNLLYKYPLKFQRH